MLAETAVDTFLLLLQDTLPEELAIKDYVISEQSLNSVPLYPIVFVLCPEYEITEWQEDGYADAKFTLTIGVLSLQQDTATLRRELYTLLEAIIKEVISSQNRANFGYALQHRGAFRANFSPIFTNASQEFTADAQVTFQVQRTVVEILA